MTQQRTTRTPSISTKLRALLAQAGIATANLEIIYASTTPEFATLLQIYQADLAKVGLDVAITPLEQAGFAAARTNLKFDLFLGSHTLGNLAPQSGMLGMSYGPERNWGGFKDDAYSQLVNRVLYQTDTTRLQELYGELNDYYLDQSFVQHIVPVPERVAAGPNVRGLRFDLFPALVPSEIWLA
jgi:ABC-type transport system substrate-binding protein